MEIKILIVEDDRIVARSLKIALEALEYPDPEIVYSGKQIVQKVAEIKPNLILMDVHLGSGPDGIEVSQTIAQEFDIPIIYITAHSDEKTLNRIRQTEPLGYILKPFRDQELRAAIEIALYKHDMEGRLRKQTQWLATILNSIGDGVIVTDMQARIMMLNPVAEKLTGWSALEAIGKPAAHIFAVINEHSRLLIDNPFVKVIEAGETISLPEHSVLIRKDGSEVPIGDSLAPIKDLRGVSLLRGGSRQITGTVAVFHDNTQQRTTAKRLHRHAFYDNLTGIPNRAWFRERLTDAVERVKRYPEYLFAVLLLDMDRFKVINDSMGHDAGDQLLIGTATRINHSIRTIDTASRLGGDEFAVLLENLRSEEEAFKVVQRIHEELSKPFHLNGKEIFTNASIGIVLSSIGYSHIDELIRDADIAMYRAKAKGKGRHQVFDTEMRDQVVAASQLEHDLRSVLKRGNLLVHYQPIVALATQKIVGFEALIRWQHPQRGLVAANDFIAIAEETGLIIQLDQWVLAEACKQTKAWQNQFPSLSEIKISVNVSGKHFSSLNLVADTAQMLEDAGFNPSCLSIEITESAMIEYPETAAVILAELRALGVCLSLDDFGIGYSSLSYLHRFPVDTLKIDRSFISNLDTDSSSFEIVRAIAALGKSLNIQIVAEGIETANHLALLQALLCEFGQGYLFSKPLSALGAEAFLKADQNV